ncbi:unnamed protein product [Brachionus calyciflorus]|uniref:Uncharacterized protein n=1 Tax=Brachionus calyciflorus TaxID=104777 RepID=A0A814FYU0_9BILA|nr:unnamed protein product [Brachionus calyciflorus]
MNMLTILTLSLFYAVINGNLRTNKIEEKLIGNFSDMEEVNFEYDTNLDMNETNSNEYNFEDDETMVQELDITFQNNFTTDSDFNMTEHDQDFLESGLELLKEDYNSTFENSTEDYQQIDFNGIILENEMELIDETENENLIQNEEFLDKFKEESKFTTKVSDTIDHINDTTKTLSINLSNTIRFSWTNFIFYFKFKIFIILFFY